MVGALRDLVPVVQLKKVEQHPWTSVTFRKFTGVSFILTHSKLYTSKLYKIMIMIIIELTHSKTILEITAEIEPQPAALDFKNLSQYPSRSK